MSSAPREKTIQFRVTAEEKRWIEEQAQTEGVRPSDWARARCLTTPVVNVSGSGNGTYAVTSVSPSPTGLYASNAHLAAVETRLAVLEQTPGVADAIAKAQKHITKKPTT